MSEKTKPLVKKEKVTTSALDAILNQYDNSQKKSSTGGGKSYDLKNYFSPRLNDKEKNGSKTIRILPNKAGGTPFIEVYVHKSPTDKTKKLICLKDNFGKDCPFCETREALLASKLDTDKELAKEYGSRKTYVVRVIDRDLEEDGVKFWRFNHDYRNEGIFDKLIDIFKNKGFIADSSDKEGRDITLNMKRNTQNRVVISSITDHDKSNLSDDEDQTNLWVNDEKTWEDIYSIRSYEYLEIIVKGGVPAWSEEENGWVDKETLDEKKSDELSQELSIGGKKPKKDNSEIEAEIKNSKNDNDDNDDNDDDEDDDNKSKKTDDDDEDDDDLPF
jgi:hypothetical protein